MKRKVIFYNNTRMDIDSYDVRKIGDGLN